MSPIRPVLLASVLLAGSHFVASPVSALEDGVIAIVNGNPISTIAVDNVASQLTESGEARDQETIVNELINMEVLTQAAEKIELEKLPEVAAAIHLQYTQTMANAYLAKISSELEFTDEELQAEYDLQSANVDTSEYRAAHILVGNQETADDVLADLAEGKDFGSMANLYSTDPSGQSGGDLGWMQSSSLPPEFVDAIAPLDVGDHTPYAVQTDFGLHIIKLIDKRNAALPDFESVKPGLNDLLARKALAAHMQKLRDDAEIER